MSLEFRTVEPDELPAFVHAQAVAGGGHRTQEDVDRLLPGFQGTTPRAAYEAARSSRRCSTTRRRWSCPEAAR